MKKIIVTIDVEDWFQVESMRGKFPIDTWESQQYRVERNVERILYLLEEKGASATFFCLANIAEKFPSLISSIHESGHEIASHGYNHVMLNQLSDDEITEDLYKSKNILENIICSHVDGYRAPTFSIASHVYPILKKLGYKYDSSLNLFQGHDRYGSVNPLEFENLENGILMHNSGIREFTIPTISKFGASIPWGGGGYFRLLPYFVYKKGVQSYLNYNDFFMFYLHPWELDPDQPKISDISLSNKFRHYNNLARTYEKFSSLLNDFKGVSISNYDRNTPSNIT